jgi:hypothetical protein
MTNDGPEGAPRHFLVIGYDDSAEGGSRFAENQVAPSLAIQLVPILPSAFTTSRPDTMGSRANLDLYDLLGDRRRDRLSVLLEALQVEGDGLSDVSQRLAPGRSLGQTTWKRRNFGNEDSMASAFRHPLVYICYPIGSCPITAPGWRRPRVSASGRPAGRVAAGGDAAAAVLCAVRVGGPGYAARRGSSSASEGRPSPSRSKTSRIS